MTAFLAISMLVQTLYLLADLYWVGHLGKERSCRWCCRQFHHDSAGADANARRRNDDAHLASGRRKDQPQAEFAFNQSFVMSLIVARRWASLVFFCAILCESLSADARLRPWPNYWFGLFRASSSVSPGGVGIGVARDRYH